MFNVISSIPRREIDGPSASTAAIVIDWRRPTAISHQRRRKKDTITVANELSLATGITEWLL